MIDLDLFDHHAAEFEDEFAIAIRRAFTEAADGIDIAALIAAIEAGDEEAVATALNIDEGLHSGLSITLNNGLFYALLGAVVISMKRFATSHGSRVNPSGEAAKLREDIRRNILEPLARRAFEAPMTVFHQLRTSGMASRVVAEAMVRSIALAPDQARSAAHFARAFHEALNSPDRTVERSTITIPPLTARRIIDRHSRHLNAAQRSSLRKTLAGEMTAKSIDQLIRRHDRALADYRQSVLARQEAVRAIHVGEYLAFKQGKANRSLPRDARRFWLTRGDERVRHDHRLVTAMNRNGVDVGEAFKTPLGPVMHPPLEVNCRCRIVVRRPSEQEQ